MVTVVPIFSKSESPQVRIQYMQPRNPRLEPLPQLRLPVKFPNSISLPTLIYRTGECDAAFLQPPRPLGGISPILDRGPGGHFRGWLTCSVDWNRDNTHHDTVHLPTIATERYGEAVPNLTVCFFPVASKGPPTDDCPTEDCSPSPPGDEHKDAKD